jgi:beta-phosphoglucomutase-like phosphatase (HAD superfamily)
MKPKHLIFDMDGTIIDSMPVHRSSWAEFAARHGLLGRPDELERATSGRTGVEGMRALFGTELPLAVAEAYVHEKESLYREQFGAAFRWVAGFERFALQAQAGGLRCGLGTAGDRHNIRFCLERLPPALRGGLFEVCVGGDEGLPGKPAPAIFLEVARRLQVDPADCLVFEDSPAGIAAAGRAGMRAVALLTSHSAAELSGAHVIAAVRDYDELLASALCPL